MSRVVTVNAQNLTTKTNAANFALYRADIDRNAEGIAIAPAPGNPQPADVGTHGDLNAMRIAKWIAALMLLLVVVGLAYGGFGYVEALQDSKGLIARADRLIADNRGGGGLGEGRLDKLIAVQDPGFFEHTGIDLSSRGAGITTMTQSLAKRVGFEKFRPGVRKIRQTGYAIGLERRLSKPQIVALFLDTVEMGQGPDGWMTGFYAASEAIHQKPVAEMSDREFLSLVAVMIAPGKYDLRNDDAALNERVDRIEKLVSERCEPLDLYDVWLEGCV